MKNPKIGIVIPIVQHKYIIEWLATWTLEEPRTLNIITVKLEPLKEYVHSKLRH